MVMNEKYWTQRYLEDNTPWDMGNAAPPLTGFLQGFYHRQQPILIPGAGNAYEAEWLWANGFTNVFVVDISEEPLKKLKQRCPHFPEDHLLHTDFFNLNLQFDLVLEQTFFCALPPELRPDYVSKMKDILKPGGHLTGVLFDFPLTEKGPPYGGSEEEYRTLFANSFSIYKMERCYNSIKPRAEKEIFIHFIRA